ncbi:hypothetical protein PP707_07630, partial [Acetobacter pasteurianus]|nr:hypothetical protein [Acetobacter pasteurianus]
MDFQKQNKKENYNAKVKDAIFQKPKKKTKKKNRKTENPKNRPNLLHNERTSALTITTTKATKATETGTVTTSAIRIRTKENTFITKISIDITSTKSINSNQK